MFTGIVEEMGHVLDVDVLDVDVLDADGLDADGDGLRLRVAASRVLDDVALGASIAVNGCCLTVVDWGSFDHTACAAPSWWAADLSAETMLRTNLGELRRGDPVNLERPVRLTDRLGGHLVQGHVDAVGEVVRPAPGLRVRTPAALRRYVVAKGSITVDGVSLTVVDTVDDGFTVAVIAHTAAVTTLGARSPGDHVNLEVDIVAKYVERLLGAGRREEA